MTAIELLRNALEREHEKRISLAKDGERVAVAAWCITERDRFEAAIQGVDHSMTLKEQEGLWAAVYALGMHDPDEAGAFGENQAGGE